MIKNPSLTVLAALLAMATMVGACSSSDSGGSDTGTETETSEAETETSEAETETSEAE
ncbi:MAG: hypothetical protein O3C27_05080 [Actinomycetota bacterium]|nr:hypothetical protein [Actinomycetota bacterium]